MGGCNFIAQPDFKWANIFIRDILLIFVTLWVNFSVSFRSWSAAFAVGMLVVLISWHFDEYIKEKQKIKLR